MNKILVLLVFCFSQAAMAYDLKVINVSIETPFPTGLESNAMAAPEENFAEMIFNRPEVKPLLDKTLEMYKDTVEGNQKIGGSFYREGESLINCDEKVLIIGQQTDLCTFEVVKSFGWYADIELGFKVTGTLEEADIPKGTYYIKDSKFIQK